MDSVRTDVANSLLKLLEEPPEYLRIIMLSESRRVIPTILSRVQVIESDRAGELSDQWSEALKKLPVDTPSQRAKIRAILYLASLRHNQIKAENVVGPFQD
jgi:DNA polymerase III delta prime subunit